MANIIIKKPGDFGKTRSEQEENMRKEWGSTLTDEMLDKCKHVEKKMDEELGSKKNFINPVIIEDFFNKDESEHRPGRK